MAFERNCQLSIIVTSPTSQGKTLSPNIKPRDMVVIKNYNTVPMKWPLRRILKVYPANDGYIKIAEVKIESLKLPESKIYLCIL